MITHLRGTLVTKELTRAVVDVQGVGYEIHIPLSTYDKLPPEGQDVILRTILHVREDLMQLYGFFAENERRLFTLVTTSVSGIGPKIGLSVLSCMSVDRFCAHVVNQDAKALSSINGVGKRTAERMIVELKSKIGEVSPSIALTGKAPDDEAAEASAGALSTSAEDAVAGLVTLGIKPDSARKTIRSVIDDLAGKEADTQKLIRLALSFINK